MKKAVILLSTLAMAGVGCSDSDDGDGGSGGEGTMDVSVSFAAVVGSEPFVCGTTYDNLGADDASLELSDFRFYVQSVALKNEADDYVPVTLEGSDWQSQGTTLIDFEDGCTDLGNEPTNLTVVGTVPRGTYDGLRFEMGVPFESNHENPATAPPPLNLTSMHWNWQGGYKFLRIDTGNFSDTDWRMHLGSTACDGDPVSGGTTACGTPNRVEVELASFDPNNDVVLADFAALVDGAQLDFNQGGTPVGCMAGPMDSDCAALFDNLGLPFGGNEPSGPQTFFSVD